MNQNHLRAGHATRSGSLLDKPQLPSEAPTPDVLQQLITQAFPPDATCWSQAGDEVRDMCRGARELARGSYSEAVNFKDLDSPARWNTAGVAGIVKFYSMLDARGRLDFCARFAGCLGYADVDD